MTNDSPWFIPLLSSPLISRLEVLSLVTALLLLVIGPVAPLSSVVHILWWYKRHRSCKHPIVDAEIRLIVHHTVAHSPMLCELTFVYRLGVVLTEWSVMFYFITSTTIFTLNTANLATYSSMETKGLLSIIGKSMVHPKGVSILHEPDTVCGGGRAL